MIHFNFWQPETTTLGNGNPRLGPFNSILFGTPRNLKKPSYSDQCSNAYIRKPIHSRSPTQTLQTTSHFKEALPGKHQSVCSSHSKLESPQCVYSSSIWSFTYGFGKSTLHGWTTLLHCRSYRREEVELVLYYFSIKLDACSKGLSCAPIQCIPWSKCEPGLSKKSCVFKAVLMIHTLLCS